MKMLNENCKKYPKGGTKTGLFRIGFLRNLLEQLFANAIALNCSTASSFKESPATVFCKKLLKQFFQKASSQQTVSYILEMSNGFEWKMKNEQNDPTDISHSILCIMLAG